MLNYELVSLLRYSEKLFRDCGGGTSTIVLSENSFAFCLKREEENKHSKKGVKKVQIDDSEAKPSDMLD